MRQELAEVETIDLPLLWSLVKTLMENKTQTLAKFIEIYDIMPGNVLKAETIDKISAEIIENDLFAKECYSLIAVCLSYNSEVISQLHDVICSVPQIFSFDNDYNSDKISDPESLIIGSIVVSNEYMYSSREELDYIIRNNSCVLAVYLASIVSML